MTAEEVIWVRYDWDVTELKCDLQVPSGYSFRSARNDELDTVIKVVLTAYASDPVWTPLISAINKRMTERISTTLGTLGMDYLVAEFNGSLVAVCGVATKHWTDQNLVTGLCVLPAHQRKGLGRCLLGMSLMRLREFGLTHARVYTEFGSVADRNLYPMYGSTRVEGAEYPGAKRNPRERKK